MLASWRIWTFFLDLCKSSVLFQQICLAVGYYALRLRAHRLGEITTEYVAPKISAFPVPMTSLPPCWCPKPLPWELNSFLCKRFLQWICIATSHVTENALLMIPIIINNLRSLIFVRFVHFSVPLQHECACVVYVVAENFTDDSQQCQSQRNS